MSDPSVFVEGEILGAFQIAEYHFSGWGEPRRRGGMRGGREERGGGREEERGGHLVILADALIQSDLQSGGGREEERGGGREEERGWKVEGDAGD